MATEILPVGEIVLTIQHDLIGAGYDYLLRGPTSNPVNDTGSFGLTGNGPDRTIRFDHCFMIVPESPIGWTPSDEDKKGFFRFELRKESGELVSDVSKDLSGDLKYVFKGMVHYVGGHSHIYDVPAPADKAPDGKYVLTVSVNPALVACAPARFYLGFQGTDIWMTQAPDRPLTLLPLIEGAVTWRDLNPAAPPPKVA